MMSAVNRDGFRRVLMSFALVFAAVCALLLGLLCVQPAYALWKYDGEVDTSWANGDGDSYTIENGAQLAGLSYLVDQGQTFKGKTITLSQDVDVSGHEWEPIGDPYSSEKRFEGTFDGRDHTVSGLIINNSEQCQALFGRVRDATIENMTVTGSVTCRNGGAGIVSQASAAQLRNLTNYVNVIALGDVPYWDETKSYSGDAAGVVCYSTALYDSGSSTYENLVNYGNIRATSPSGCGGVAGFLLASDGYTFNLVKCKNYGNVYISQAENVEDLTDGVGGVLGATAEMGTYKLNGCVNEGSVTASNLGTVGGVAGSIRGTNSEVDHCANKGSITNLGTNFDAPAEETPTAGGIAAQFDSEGGLVSNSYSSGTVSASSGYSAAIIGASTQNMADIAKNNFYLEGSSTGAFNDWKTGEASDRIMTGSSATQEELDSMADAEAGGVAEMNMADYNFVEIDPQSYDQQPQQDQPEDNPLVDLLKSDGFKLACIALFLLMVAAGATSEAIRFKRETRKQVA